MKFQRPQFYQILKNKYYTIKDFCKQKVVRGINEEADKEALRILKLSPKWLPDIQNGRPRRVAYTLPVTFPNN